jgi:hypothetical protein
MVRRTMIVRVDVAGAVDLQSPLFPLVPMSPAADRIPLHRVDTIDVHPEPAPCAGAEAPEHVTCSGEAVSFLPIERPA